MDATEPSRAHLTDTYLVRKIHMPARRRTGDIISERPGDFVGIRSYDLLKGWRDHASDVRGHGIDSGHFIPEEQPDQVCAALKDFFSA